jgi:hypothetical protein
MRAVPDHLLRALRFAAEFEQIITIELVQDGVKKYIVTLSIFAGEPTENPMLARNYAEDAKNDFRQLFYDLDCVYVKDVGGGKSAQRSDVPPQIVIFAKPAAPAEVGRLAAY